MKHCGHCGSGIGLLRKDARFCSTKCRVAAHRAAKRAIPSELAERPRWVRWKPLERRGKATKVPMTTAGRNASSTDPATWTTHAAATASAVGAGLGFVLNGDGIGVIDLDKCIDGDKVADWAKPIIEANAGTFMEVSVSGSGVHIWGMLPAGKGQKIRDGRNIEIYSTGRYIALGEPMKGTTAELRPLVLPQSSDTQRS